MAIGYVSLARRDAPWCNVIVCMEGFESGVVNGRVRGIHYRIQSVLNIQFFLPTQGPIIRILHHTKPLLNMVRPSDYGVPPGVQRVSPSAFDTQGNDGGVVR